MALLKEIADVQTGPFGSQLHKEDYVEVGTPIVTVEHLGNKIFTEQNLPMVSDEDRDRLVKYVLKEGDTVFSRVGSVDRCSYVDTDHDGWMFSGRCLRVRPNENVDPEYLYYFFTTEATKQLIRSIAVGATMPSINTKILSEVEVPLPSIDKQRNVAEVLSTIDAKIAVNDNINRNLSEQISAIYQDWFVNGNRYEKDENGNSIGVTNVSLADLMDYAGGSQPPASEFIDEEKEGYIRFVQIRDYDADNHITYIPISSRNKLCNKFDIMIARYGAALGRICFGLDGAYNVALAKVFPKKEYYREYLRAYLSSAEFYEGINIRGGRSAQSGFNQSDIKSFRLDFPVNDSVVKEFEELVHPIMEERLRIKEENNKLARVRDSLLPKLMSGDIDITEIE